MEVLASLAAGLGGDAAKGAAARDAAKRYLRLTKAQIISSLLSLGDWVSDWVYAIQALAWAAGEYIMIRAPALARGLLALAPARVPPLLRGLLGRHAVIVPARAISDGNST